MAPAPEIRTIAPAAVYTTVLFSDAHVVSLSQIGDDDESEESPDVPRFVLVLEEIPAVCVDIAV